MREHDQGSGGNPLDTHRLLETAFQRHASELIVQSDRRPLLIIDGATRAIEAPVVSPEDACAFFKSITPDKYQKQYIEEGQAVFCFTFGDRGRVHVSVCRDAANITTICKLLTAEPPALCEESARENLKRLFAGIPRGGLCLFIGPSHTAKAAGLAATVKFLAEDRSQCVCTFAADYRKPVETAGLVVRRELCEDVASLYEGVRFALRSGFTATAFHIAEEPEDIITAVRAAMGGLRALITLSADSAEHALAVVEAAVAHSDGMRRAVAKMPGFICEPKLLGGRIELAGLVTLPR